MGDKLLTVQAAQRVVVRLGVSKPDPAPSKMSPAQTFSVQTPNPIVADLSRSPDVLSRFGLPADRMKFLLQANPQLAAVLNRLFSTQTASVLLDAEALVQVAEVLLAALPSVTVSESLGSLLKSTGLSLEAFLSLAGTHFPEPGPSRSPVVSPGLPQNEAETVRFLSFVMDSRQPDARASQKIAITLMNQCVDTEGLQRVNENTERFRQLPPALRSQVYAKLVGDLHRDSQGLTIEHFENVVREVSKAQEGSVLQDRAPGPRTEYLVSLTTPAANSDRQAANTDVEPPRASRNISRPPTRSVAVNQLLTQLPDLKNFLVGRSTANPHSAPFQFLVQAVVTQQLKTPANVPGVLDLLFQASLTPDLALQFRVRTLAVHSLRGMMKQGPSSRMTDLVMKYLETFARQQKFVRDPTWMRRAGSVERQSQSLDKIIQRDFRSVDDRPLVDLLAETITVKMDLEGQGKDGRQGHSSREQEQTVKEMLESNDPFSIRQGLLLLQRLWKSMNEEARRNFLSLVMTLADDLALELARRGWPARAINDPLLLEAAIDSMSVILEKGAVLGRRQRFHVVGNAELFGLARMASRQERNTAFLTTG